MLSPSDYLAIDEDDFRALLAKARAGSKESLAEAIRLCFGMAVPFARRYRYRTCGPSESDLMQMAYIELESSFHAFRGDTKHEFRRWLISVLVFLQIDVLRSDEAAKRGGARTRLLVDMDLDRLFDGLIDKDDVLREAMARENLELLSRALERLEPGEREIVEMHYLYGRTFEFVGETLHQTADAARMACGRALKKLRRILGAKTEREFPRERT